MDNENQKKQWEEKKTDGRGKDAAFEATREEARRKEVEEQ